MKYRMWFPKGQAMVRYYADQKLSEAGPFELMFEGETPEDLPVDLFAENPISHILEFLWQRHNEGDNLDGNRPRATEIRSMCVGDIIELLPGREYWMVDVAGWKELRPEELPAFSS